MVRKMADQAAHTVQRPGTSVRDTLSDRRGEASIEYALIAGGIVLAIIVGITNYTGSIGTMFAMIANKLGGGE